MASTSTTTANPNRPTLGPSPFTVPADLPKLPEVQGTDSTRCVLDSFRIAIAKAVADGLDALTVEQVYQGVDYGKKGEDFTVALPRFRLPGKVDELAKKVIDKVCTPSASCFAFALQGLSSFSFGQYASPPNVRVRVR